MTKNLEQCDRGKPRECSNHKIFCFRWLASRADRRNKANGVAKVDNVEKEVQEIFQNAGAGAELQVEAEHFRAKLDREMIARKKVIKHIWKVLKTATEKAYSGDASSCKMYSQIMLETNSVIYSVNLK
jgi:phage tail tape-measure protein